MKADDWSVEPLSGGWMSLDGGCIFGLVPKSVWSKLVECDDKNLIRIPNRCLLARNGSEIVLFDTGYGSKYPRLDRVAYLMEQGNPLFRALHERGIAPQDVGHVVMTHLHFDHAGGATVLDDNKRAVPAFPNAKYYASAVEWQDAIAPVEELRAAYPQNNILPLVDKNLNISFDDAQEILPGVTMTITGGHTRGHAVAALKTKSGPVCFPGDLAPTAWHIKMLWTTSYDTFILQTRCQKSKFFAEALESQALVYWSHDPHVISSRITGKRVSNYISTPVLTESDTE